MKGCYGLSISGEGCLLAGMRLFKGQAGLNGVPSVILSRVSLCGRCKGSARRLRFSYVTLG